MRDFKVNNIHCNGCANRIKNALKDEFGEVEINLDAEPKIVSLEITDELIPKLRANLDELGFEFVEEIK